jgi:hypothetical protein
VPTKIFLRDGLQPRRRRFAKGRACRRFGAKRRMMHGVAEFAGENSGTALFVFVALLIFLC